MYKHKAINKGLVENEIEDGLMEYGLYPPEDYIIYEEGLSVPRLSEPQLKELLLGNAKSLMENYRLEERNELIEERKLDENIGYAPIDDKIDKCLCCSSINVKIIGSAFDGVSANFQYRCDNCNKEWEGE